MPSPSPDSQFIIGVDLGGTNVVVSAMSLDGSRLFGALSEPTLAVEGAEAVVTRMARMVNATIETTMKDAGVARSAFIGVGIGAPGTVDREKGLVLAAPNLKWYDFPLIERMTALTGLPVRIDNDANCATYGEWWLGAARGGVNVIGVTIGTGVGGGIIIDRHVYHGSSDAAGEIGHITIDLNGRRCGCGNYGCLEAYASGSAIAERAREALHNDESSVLPTLVGGDLSRITAAVVYKAAGEGDALALEIVRDTARYLGAGLANLLNVFNPDVVVIAGGVTQAGEALFGPLRTEVRRRAFKSVSDRCQIVPGTLPGTAGVVGAVASFISQTTGRPPA
ncbi:MAG: ROK family protein [Gemmatimonadaceae bacterium]|uniref:ROK family protein n=1 Tax=Gemmatimonas sp. TaxID=1962908 RepID=UPI001DBF200D|nr:ROK family protein [Gemmatimonas sp.]NCW45419.1 ROK family protein [Gemmatimonadaceae bacterium]